MSVIVKGMEMPVSGARYRVVEDLEGNKYLATDRLFSGWYYPISPLPEKHGRLIDADALGAFPYNMSFCDGGEADEWIEDAPTIVEAEGE